MNTSNGFDFSFLLGLQHPDSIMESDPRDDEESPILGTIRSKCVTQLLLLGAIDSIQVSHAVS